MQLSFPPTHKKKSLEDHLYFTLKDIFHNCDIYQHCMRANSFNGKLTGDIYYEDRTETFQYQPVLQSAEFVDTVCQWLDIIKPSHFDLQCNQTPPTTHPEEWFCLSFDEWWNGFEDLRCLMNQRRIDLMEQQQVQPPPQQQKKLEI